MSLRRKGGGSHIEREDQNFFPQAEKLPSGAQRHRIGAAMARLRDEAVVGRGKRLPHARAAFTGAARRGIPTKV
jgi:hypothetical protein